MLRCDWFILDISVTSCQPSHLLYTSRCQLDFLCFCFVFDNLEYRLHSLWHKTFFCDVSMAHLLPIRQCSVRLYHIGVSVFLSLIHFGLVFRWCGISLNDTSSCIHWTPRTSPATYQSCLYSPCLCFCFPFSNSVRLMFRWHGISVWYFHPQSLNSTSSRTSRCQLCSPCPCLHLMSLIWVAG